MEQLINKLKKRLNEDLPGQDAQYRMAPIHRTRVEVDFENNKNYVQSAVMIVLYKNENNDWYLPLIERKTYNGIHSGQIGLPGGKFEKQDVDLLNTALRECEEEIGIHDIEPIGALSPLVIPVSGFLVKPFIGIHRSKKLNYQLQEREVEQVLNLSLNYLLDETNIVKGEIFVNDNLKIKTPYLEVQSKKVWGATAMILSELKEVLLSIS